MCDTDHCENEPEYLDAMGNELCSECVEIELSENEECCTSDFQTL